MYQDRDAGEKVEDRDAILLVQAGGLVMEGGLPSLTLRSLAQAAGVSPSLVTYRFGSREMLVRRMFEAARVRDGAFWQRMEERTGGLALSPGGLAGLMAVTAGAREQVLRWACASEAARVPALQDISRDWSRHGLAFWRSILARAGCDEALAPAMSACMLWVIRVGLTAPGEALLTHSWMMDLAHRLAARLFGEGVVSAADSPARQQIEALAQRGRTPAEGPRKPTPERIIDAAAKLAGERGPGALTHRLIAKEAGVSLSSMTHHFASLGEIQHRAFAKLYEHARKASGPDLPANLSIDTFTREIMPAILRRAEAQGHSAIAMDEIILAASRASHTEALGSGLMALVGQSSTVMLKAMAGDMETDRLDGQLFRFVITGLNEQADLQPEDQRDTWFAENCALLLRRYLKGRASDDTQGRAG